MGVPLIVPVVVEKLNPAGKLGLIENTKGDTPALPVTGVKGVIASPTVSVRLAIARFTISAGGASTVRLNVLELL